uniref:Uncharacterized protein n=1 Tax=Ascaris lumbricoides TaxID=6252 RepID=A0A9J2PHP3_ASCLU
MTAISMIYHRMAVITNSLVSSRQKNQHFKKLPGMIDALDTKVCLERKERSMMQLMPDALLTKVSQHPSMRLLNYVALRITAIKMTSVKRVNGCDGRIQPEMSHPNF